ncbi:hypothetical protein ACE38W_03805 [Chitinophaga sp. Hz27]|uniref:hypothetical protein n=1 Tax=Chitinophaga sp. Hz27 TaxID=3347169 RepID=UPI0035D8D5EC
MKYLIFLIITFFSTAAVCKAQSGPTTHDAGIVQRLTDSLHLTATQQSTLLQTSVNISQQKMQVRQTITNADSLRLKLQQIENGRDALYKDILTPSAFQLYKGGKNYFLNGRSK